MKYLIKESQYVHLLENLEKTKKFLTNHIGIDFTGKFKKITKAFDVPYNFFRKGGISLNAAMSFIEAFGPMYFFELGDREYLYQDRGNKDWFVDEYGHLYIKDEFSKRLGIDELGLRFSDIIDIYFNEGGPLNESVEKNKKFLTKLLGEDLINSIREITSPNQLPKEFLKSIGTTIIQRYIDVYGPLYYFVLDGEPFLYKERISPKGEKYEMYITDKGKSYLDGEITDRLGLSDMGLNFSDVVDTIFNDEDEVITEGKQDDMIERLLKSEGITYDINYKKRSYFNGDQLDSVDITFYYDHGIGRKPEAMKPVYFKTRGNKIIPYAEPIIYGNFDWIFDVFEAIPLDVLNKFFADKAKAYLEKYLPIEYPFG